MVHLDAHKGQTVGNAGTNGRSVLTDASGEDQRVHAAHGSSHLGSLGGNLVDKHVEGELSIGVTSGGELLDVAAVVGLAAGHSQKAGLLVHHLVDLVEGVAAFALQVAHSSRVDGAAAGAHHDTVERRQAHGGVHALAVLDGAQGSAGTDVAHDDLASLAVGHLGNLLGDIAVAGAVGAILTDVQLVANILGKGVGLGDLGHVEVESGVIDRDVGQVGILLEAVLDNVGLGVVVQRRQRGDLADLGENVLVDEGGIAKVPTALDDTVANALDLNAVGLEVLQDDFDGDLVVGELDVLGHLLGTVGSVGEGTAGKADALAGALCGHLVGLGIDDLILKGRRSRVDDQNVHVSPY